MLNIPSYIFQLVLYPIYIVPFSKWTKLTNWKLADCNRHIKYNHQSQKTELFKQDNRNFQIFPSTCCPFLQHLSHLIGQGGSCMDKMWPSWVMWQNDKNLPHFQYLKLTTVSIGRSRGRAGCTPLWDWILWFSHTFLPKSAHVGGPRPPNGSTPPLREILDRPLVSLRHMLTER